MARSETARLIAELTLKDKLTPGVGKALGSVDRLDRGMGRVTRGAGQMASGLSKAGTRVAAGIGLGLVGAAKAAIDWESSFTGVLKTVDAATFETGENFDTLARQLRDMATEMPNSAAELAGIAEMGGALGIAGTDIAEFTRQVAILASTTDVSAEDAATALGQLQNVLGLTGDEFDNFAATLVDLGNKGASTESQILEIARRAGGSAKLFGLAADETLAWASAAANLGINEELAGTALQKLFLTVLPTATKHSKDFAKVMGMTGDQVVKAFKDDAGGALEGFIEGLSEMNAESRLTTVQGIFGKGSGTTRLILGLADSFDKNLTPALETANKAWIEGTAAQVEFDKRNATVASAIARLKNGVIDAGISIGEGFVPALGRAADKLSTFLKSDVNRNALKSIGEDIGKAIDDIDWKQVLDGTRAVVDMLKVGLDFAKRLFDAFNALPTEIKGAAVGIAALNKLSGGMVGGALGNIAGGLAETVVRGLGASLPGTAGKLFAQPVFVTNWPVGGIGGAGGAGGAASLAALLGPAIALGVGSHFLTEAANQELRNNGGTGQLASPFEGPFGIIGALKNIKVAIENWGRKPTADADRTMDGLEDVRAEVGVVDKAVVQTADQLRREHATQGSQLREKQLATTLAAQRAGEIGAGATHTAAQTISSSIAANRPITNVSVSVTANSVVKTVTTTNRNGSGPPSRDNNRGENEFG